MSVRSEAGTPADAGGEDFERACERVGAMIEGPARREIVERAGEAGGLEDALRALRGEMRAHMFKSRSDLVALKPVVEAMDRRTRKEGFNVLHDWEGRTETFNREIIPVDMLDYALSLAPRGGCVAEAPALLLDYYLLHVLGLMVMRAWDGGDADRDLARIAALLEGLQGPGGSGLRLVDDAEMLLWIAISNYHPDDDAYDRVLDRVRTLDDGARLRFALAGAGILGSHLRWGFEAYYKRDLDLLRRDNFADYPWLLFSLVTLLEAYAGMHDRGEEGPLRGRIVSALLNGLTSDVPAFLGEMPEALAAHREERERFTELYRRLHDDLLEEFKAIRPSPDAYSPIAFHYNFPHNAVKARMGMALAGEEAPNLPLDALVTGGPVAAEEDEARLAMAEALNDYSRRHPDRIGRRRVMVVAYSPKTASRSFRAVLWGGDGGDAPDGAGGDVATAEAGRGRLEHSPFQRGAMERGEG